MKRQEKVTKGQFRYIDTKKRQQFINSIVMFGVAAAIFLIGLLLNKFEKANVFTILAALFVLPSTKQLVNFIVLAPFHSVKEEQFQKVKKHIRTEDTLYTDVVFTSPQKVMYLSYLTIIGSRVIGLIGREKENAVLIQEYLQNGIQLRGMEFTVSIYKDEKNFIEKINKAKQIDKEVDEKSKKKEVDEKSKKKEVDEKSKKKEVDEKSKKKEVDEKNRTETFSEMSALKMDKCSPSQQEELKAYLLSLMV